MDDKAAYVHDNPLFSPTFRGCAGILYQLHCVLKFLIVCCPFDSAKDLCSMKIFSCCSSLRCWDVHAVTSESKKKTPKNTPKKSPKNTPKNTPQKTPKNLEKNASSIELEMDFSSGLSQSSVKTRDSNPGSGRHSRRQSVIEDDTEWEGLDELRMKVRRLMEEQEEENSEIYDTEEGHIMSYSGSPVIIQAGGVASYHPLHSPSAPRPRFLRYGVSSPESSIHKHKPADIQRSETNSKAKENAEEEKEADQGQNGEKSEVIEEYLNESHSPQLAQDPPSLEDPRSEITTEDAEQPQESTEPDNTAEPNPNSLPTQNSNRSTVGFKTSRPGICIGKMMLPLFMFLVLSTAASGFGLLENNYSGFRIMQYQSDHMKPLPLTERVSLPQKMKGFFSLLWEPVHSEYMGRMTKSSSAFVGKLVGFFYHYSCSCFSYLKSYKGSITEENWAKFINFCRRLIDILLSFYQDKSVSTGENHESCKCFNSNQTAEPMNLTCPVDSSTSKNTTVDTDQAIKDETNQRIQDNSFTNPIQEATSFTIDVNHVHPEYNDQYFEQNSVFYEKDESQGSECSSFPKVSKAKRVHFDPTPLEFPVREPASSITSPGVPDNLGLDKKSPGINWKRVILVPAVCVILLILIAGGNLYLGWREAQEMEVKSPRQRNNPRQRRQQIEQSLTPPMLGSFVQYSREPTPNAVRRSVRIRNKSLSPVPAQPTFTSPSSGHSFS